MDLLVKQPHVFAQGDEHVQSTCIEALYALYKQAKQHEPEECGVLEEIPQGLDLEQVWAVLQQRHEPLMEWANDRLDELEKAVHSLDDALQGLHVDEEGSEEAEDEDSEQEYLEDEEEAEEENEQGEESDMEKIEEEGDPSEEEQKRDYDGEAMGVNDGFFSLREMDRFAEQEESKAGKEEDDDDDDDDIDYFQDPDDMMDEDEREEEDNLQGMYYKDFFDAPQPTNSKSSNSSKKKKRSDKKDLQERFKFDGHDKPIRYAHLEDEEEEGEEDEPQEEPKNLLESASETDEETRTKFEKQQDRLKAQIAQLEAENVGKKNWTLAGEATARTRPVNSLLEENLQFESASKVVPIITQEVTDSLEDIIKRRIMNADYNDVVRKVEPKERKYTPRENIINEEKSKLSLAEIYEQEYQQQMHNVPSAASTALEKQHEHVEKMFRDLMYKLDSLTSHNYIPPPVEIEMRTVSNVASVRVEEVMPEAVSEAKRLAPHEVHHVIGERVGKEELSKEEKHTLRLRKKRLAKLRNKPISTPSETATTTITTNDTASQKRK